MTKNRGAWADQLMGSWLFKMHRRRNMAVRSVITGVIVSLCLTQIAEAQCPGSIPCPPGNCYPAEITGFSGQCGSVGVFPAQICCITLYYVRNCRKNPDCTGDICGSALQGILSVWDSGSCSSSPVGTLQCGLIMYSPGDNKICDVYGTYVGAYLPPLPCPIPSPAPIPVRPRPGIIAVINTDYNT